MDRPITKEELENMLIKYNIGKKPLSRLLGWGETTVLLYLESDSIPDNEFTRHLYRLYMDVPQFFDLLEKNKAALTNVAYKKSKSTVMEMFKSSKILDCALYICNYMKKHPNYEHSLLRVEAILFWSQVTSLCLYGKPLFTEEYQPSRSGMPFRSVEERVKQYGCILPEGITSDKLEFDAEEKQILEYITDMLSWYGYEAIDRLMDAERYRLCGPRGARKRRMASVDMLKRCYSEVFAQAKINKLKDIDAYMQKRIHFMKKTSNKVLSSDQVTT